MCDCLLRMGSAVRIELTSPDLFVVQYACANCGHRLARTVVPRAEQPLAARLAS